MKIEFPEYGRVTEHPLEGVEMKFAVLKIVDETAKKVLILFPSELDHNIVVKNWIGDDTNRKFLGAGKADITKELAYWDSSTCLRDVIDGGFGKDKPEEPAEADKLLAQVREKVKELAKTLREA